MAGSSHGEAHLNRSQRWVGVALAWAFAGLASAQGYPTQPIRPIVPWPPGGGVGGGSAESFGQFIVAELKRYADVVKLSGAKVE